MSDETLGAALIRKAKAVQRTYVGQHWPDARTLGYNGIGVDFTGSTRAEDAAIRSYIAACNPELVIAALAATPPTQAAPERLRAALDDDLRRELWRRAKPGHTHVIPLGYGVREAHEGETRVTADLYRHRVERFSELAAEKMQEALG